MPNIFGLQPRLSKLALWLFGKPIQSATVTQRTTSPELPEDLSKQLKILQTCAKHWSITSSIEIESVVNQATSEKDTYQISFSGLNATKDAQTFVAELLKIGIVGGGQIVKDQQTGVASHRPNFTLTSKRVFTNEDSSQASFFLEFNPGFEILQKYHEQLSQQPETEEQTTPGIRK